MNYNVYFMHVEWWCS